MSCELRLCRSTKAKGTHFPADKAKDERSRSLPVKRYRERRANRAGWPFLHYAGEGRPRSCGVAAVGKRPFQGVPHAGLIDFDAVDATMQSYFGMLSHCSTHGLQKWIEKNIVFKRKEPAAEAKEVNLWT